MAERDRLSGLPQQRRRKTQQRTAYLSRPHPVHRGLCHYPSLMCQSSTPLDESPIAFSVGNGRALHGIV
jgi:hypothetical protein